MAGYNDSDISNCYSTCSVSGSSSDAGGLVGYNDSDISDCYSTGLVSGFTEVGGLVGYNDYSISNCYSTGSVTGTGFSNVGGLVGENDDSIDSCYFLDVAGPNNGNGVPLTDPNMKHQSSFVGWDFVNIRRICENVDYPELAWAYLLPPEGVSASDGTYSDKVRVTWNSVSDATAYEVWCSTDSNSSSASKLGDSNTSPFDDSSATPGTHITIGSRPGMIARRVISARRIPAMPVFFHRLLQAYQPATGLYTDKVQVTWDSVSGATGYEVWRSDSNNSSSASKLGDSNTSPFDDSSATPGTTYYYWVKARNDCGTSDFSSSDSAP